MVAALTDSQAWTTLPQGVPTSQAPPECALPSEGGWPVGRPPWPVCPPALFSGFLAHLAGSSHLLGLDGAGAFPPGSPALFWELLQGEASCACHQLPDGHCRHRASIYYMSSSSAGRSWM